MSVLETRARFLLVPLALLSFIALASSRGRLSSLVAMDATQLGTVAQDSSGSLWRFFFSENNGEAPEVTKAGGDVWSSSDVDRMVADLMSNPQETRKVTEVILSAAAMEVSQGPKKNVSDLPRTVSTDYNDLDAKERYLLYSPSGGWGNQMICLTNAIFLAQKYKRNLVLAPYGRHSNLFKGYERLNMRSLVPMDQVLDVPYLVNVTGVRMVPINMTISEFYQWWRKRGSASRYDMPKPGLGKSQSASVIGKIKRRLRSSSGLLFLRGSWFSPRYLSKTIYSNIRYSPFLQSIAHTVVEEVFDAQDFNAIHIRLGDYADRVKKRNSAARPYLKGARALGFAKGTPVYVAAEEPRSDPYFAPLLEEFDRVVFQEDLLRYPRTRALLIDYYLRTPSPAVRNDLFGLIEQVISAEATRFLGSKISTFTMRIRGMRSKLKQCCPLVATRLNESDLKKLRVTGDVEWGGKIRVKSGTPIPVESEKPAAGKETLASDAAEGTSDENQDSSRADDGG